MSLNYYNAKLSNDEFSQLSEFIYGQYGIKMPKEKKLMLESRLHKRLRENSMNSFKDYIDFVFSKEGQQKELLHMIDVVTTNKTDFFREPGHFDFLREVALPEFQNNNPRQQLKIWSAGCSSGEEPHTITMVLSEYANGINNIDYQIFATDISVRMLNHAVNGIYAEDRTRIIPMSLKKKYLLKSKDPSKKKIRIIPELRKKIKYDRLNFMDDHYDVKETFDIIFCRNVIIYFDRETQESVINKLCRNLKPGGYFFLGHSESITNMNLPLKHIKPTIFQRL